MEQDWATTTQVVVFFICVAAAWITEMIVKYKLQKNEGIDVDDE